MEKAAVMTGGRLDFNRSSARRYSYPGQQLIDAIYIGFLGHQVSQSLIASYLLCFDQLLLRLL